MGKPITAVAAASGSGTTTPITQSPSQSPSQSPVQSPAPAPKPAAPVTFWPPAYGWRLAALTDERTAHNGWQSKWIAQGASIAGASAVDSVAALKPVLRSHLEHRSH
jgi:hypothetical protein